MEKFRTVLLVGSFMQICGCATVVVDGFKVDQAQYQRQRSSLLKRAAFDLRCPEEQIKITVLASYGDSALKQAGVAGCDQHGTYISPDAQDWVLNATNGQPSNGK